MAHTVESRRRAYLKTIALRVEWIAEHGPCKCGSWLSPEVHHLDKSQKIDHRVWSWAPARRREELAKCVVMCRACHELLHAKEKMPTHCKHGHEFTEDNTIYRKHGPGKRDCKSCLREKMRRYRAIDPGFGRKKKAA